MPAKRQPYAALASRVDRATCITLPDECFRRWGESGLAIELATSGLWPELPKPGLVDAIYVGARFPGLLFDAMAVLDETRCLLLGSQVGVR